MRAGNKGVDAHSPDISAAFVVMLRAAAALTMIDDVASINENQPQGIRRLRNRQPHHTLWNAYRMQTFVPELTGVPRPDQWTAITTRSFIDAWSQEVESEQGQSIGETDDNSYNIGADPIHVWPRRHHSAQPRRRLFTTDIPRSRARRSASPRSAFIRKVLKAWLALRRSDSLPTLRRATAARPATSSSSTVLGSGTGLGQSSPERREPHCARLRAC